MAIEEKVIQPESVTNAEQPVAETPSQPQAPNLDSVKAEYEAQIAAARKEAAEAQEKFQKLKQDNTKIELHLTGPLQSNKVKTAIKLFDVFHTLDREKIAREFSKYRELLINKKFFLQVNTGKEKTKSGIFPEDTKDFLFFLRQEMELSIFGLMCIPPIDDDPGYHFNKLKLLANENKIDELSIGMSDDYEKALQFNPTYIRLGTILFGKRS